MKFILRGSIELSVTLNSIWVAPWLSFLNLPHVMYIEWPSAVSFIIW